MIKMSTTYTTSPVIPFRTVVDLSTATTAAGVVTWATVPVYNTVWIELVITSTASGNTGNVIVTPNATGGHTVAKTSNIASGATESIWVLVNGQPVGPTADLDLGSTSVTIATQDGTGHAVLSGYYVLHGHRLA
jgi:hypothetical protein